MCCVFFQNAVFGKKYRSPNKGKKATKYLIPIHKDNANTKITKPTFSLPKWANNRIYQILSIIKVAFL